MNEITAAIRKKAESKYGDYKTGSLCTRDHINGYRAGGEDAIGFMLKFVEWMGEEENPFMMVKGRWFQACGNSTSWTTEQLLIKFLEENKL